MCHFTLRKKTFPIISILLTIFLFIYLIIFFINYNLILSSEDINVEWYSDSSAIEENNGKSVVCNLSPENNHITFMYELKNGFLFPYSGIRLKFKKEKFSQSSDFDIIQIKLDSINLSSLRFILRTFDSAITDMNDPHSLKHWVNEFSVSKTENVYNIRIDEFNIPRWWYQRMQILPEKEEFLEINKLFDIEIESGELAPINKLESVQIISVQFKKDIKRIIPFISIYLILILSTLIGYIIERRLKNKRTIISYKKIELSSHFENEVHKIVNFIAENYSNSGLTLTFVSENTGISTMKVSKLVKEKFNLTFREYLNLVRITEVKRLLNETDRQINEIFWKVGYTSKTNFYRAFKNIEKMSPLQYRNSV